MKIVEIIDIKIIFHKIELDMAQKVAKLVTNKSNVSK